MAASKLASSVFTRKPDDTTVVADVYKEFSPGVVNSFQDSESSGFDIAKQFGFLSKFSSAASLDATNPLNAAKALGGKISDALGDSFGKAKTFVTDLAAGKASIAATIKSTTNQVTGLLRQANSIQYTVNGVVNSIKNGDLSSLRSATNTLNAVIGKTSVLLQPQGALSGIYTAIVGDASAAGMSGAFSVVATSIRAATDIANKGQMIYQVASGSLPSAIQRGDLKSVASMVDFIGKGSVSMMNPAAVTQLARNDRNIYTPNEIRGQAGQFVQYQSSYQKIDPNWNTSSWIPKGVTSTVKDLSSLLGASAEVKKIFSAGSKFSSNNDDKYYSLLDKVGGKRSVNNEIVSRYPMVVTPSSDGMCLRDVTPRTEYMTIS